MSSGNWFPQLVYAEEEGVPHLSIIKVSSWSIRPRSSLPLLVTGGWTRHVTHVVTWSDKEAVKCLKLGWNQTIAALDTGGGTLWGSFIIYKTMSIAVNLLAGESRRTEYLRETTTNV